MGERRAILEPGELSGLFAAPQWLRDLGFSAWLLAGVAAALIGAIWLLSLTETIVLPVIVAGIIASVTSSLVDWLRRRGVPRGIGAGLVFLAIIAVGVGVGLLVLAGIASQAASLSERLQEGASEIESWVGGLGVNSTTAANANADAGASVSAGFSALTHGLLGGVDKLASLTVLLSFTALSLLGVTVVSLWSATAPHSSCIRWRCRSRRSPAAASSAPSDWCRRRPCSRPRCGSQPTSKRPRERSRPRATIPHRPDVTPRSVISKILAARCLPSAV